MGQGERMRAAVITVSDRGARGERTDTSGPAIAAAIEALGGVVAGAVVVPDELEEIQAALLEWSDRERVDLIITTGGTGLAPRDWTPEATAPLLHRMAPGIAEALRQDGMARTPMAALGRGVAGVRGATLVVNLPGSERAAREGMSVLARILPHAVELLRSGGEHEPDTAR